MPADLPENKTPTTPIHHYIQNFNSTQSADAIELGTYIILLMYPVGFMV